MTVFSPAINGVSFSEALREAATYAPVDRVILLTYEFTHSTFTSRALIVCDYEDLTALDENGATVNFVAIGGLRSQGFEESDAAAMPTMQLQLDGVSSEITDLLDLALQTLEPIGIIERVYVSDDLTQPAIKPVAKALVRSAEITDTTVSVEVGFGDPANQPFPRKVFTRAEYPGLAAQ